MLSILTLAILLYYTMRPPFCYWILLSLWYFAACSHSSSPPVSSPSPPVEKLSAFVAGDIMLGGLFPMHEYNLSRKDMPCGAIKEEKGIQVGIHNYCNLARIKKRREPEIASAGVNNGVRKWEFPIKHPLYSTTSTYQPCMWKPFGALNLYRISCVPYTNGKEKNLKMSES